MATFDLLVRGGLVFDGTGAPGRTVDVGIRGGNVVAMAPDLPTADADQVIDADGKWVIPGMVDVHTHYDAEVLVSPGLGESVRHGVTSVIYGNCSMSAVYADPEDVADLFARVEALPWMRSTRPSRNIRTGMGRVGIARSSSHFRWAPTSRR